YRLAAEQRSAPAQYNLGVIYSDGDGVPEDDVAAVHWYQLSAKQGFPAAQYNLGVMYDNGDGVPEDDGEAIRWYQLAAEQEHEIAQFTLGMMYSKGEGVPEDKDKAIHWYRLAAEQGHDIAQTNLGVMYAQRWYRYELEEIHRDTLAEASLGFVQHDLVLSYMWFTVSATQGNEVAQRNKGAIEEWLTREQIAEAQRLSQEWLERRVQEGNEPSETIRMPNQ
ncbi:MAG TPA: hypothetical protein DIU18_06550, partial [Gemmatimonadetes bacterium]|nr:hypothetical protein [Gemmatimonadota bacterium]